MKLITAGVDVGTSAIKVAVARTGDGEPKLLATARERIHRRDTARVAELAFASALDAAGVARGEVAYVASTGDGDAVEFRDGHFYGMTTHARGATWLVPGARSVVDVGALHARVMVVDEKSRVTRSKMTSQCASGTGQFIENIARYLGVRLDEVGPLSRQAARGEACSGICAVLAETDVINMISRGIAVGQVLRGIHDSVAQRLARLLRSAAAESPVVVTGGLAADEGLVGALRAALEADGQAPLEILTHAQSVHAGAIGAALWAARRHERLARDAGSARAQG